MDFELHPYFLEFKSPFSIAHGTRNGTDLVLLKLKYNGLESWGEASLPPYLPETRESVIGFLNGFFKTAPDPKVGLGELLVSLQNFGPGNFAAKACADIALHNLFAKIKKVPVWKLIGIYNEPLPQCTYTIGMADPGNIRKKVVEAADFNILKVKLGGKDDRKIIETIRSVTDKQICVDVNQGWSTREKALEMIRWLKDMNTVFIEQPLNKSNLNDMIWLKERSPLPLFADESAQIPDDVVGLKNAFHGINVKLMKCGGIRAGLDMVLLAKAIGMQVMVGSMTESACGIMAAAQLTPLADYADLDGPLLTKNNPFTAPVYKDGKLQIEEAS